MTIGIKDQIAIAVCESCEENPYHNGDTRGNNYRWQDYLVCAEAVIKVIESNGYRLVPLEPTDEMVCIATAEYVQSCSRRLHPNIAWRRAFQAMLAAAPN